MYHVYYKDPFHGRIVRTEVSDTQFEDIKRNGYRYRYNSVHDSLPVLMHTRIPDKNWEQITQNGQYSCD